MKYWLYDLIDKAIQWWWYCTGVEKRHSEECEWDQNQLMCDRISSGYDPYEMVDAHEILYQVDFEQQL